MGPPLYIVSCLAIVLMPQASGTTGHQGRHASGTEYIFFKLCTAAKTKLPGLMCVLSGCLWLVGGLEFVLSWVMLGSLSGV